MPTLRQATRQDPSVSVRYVKGVGPARAELLAKLDIVTVEDLLLHAPHRYEDRRNFSELPSLRAGAWATVRARVLTKRFRRSRAGQPLVEAALGDGEEGALACLWFHQPYLYRMLRVGETLILYGKVEPGRRPSMINPEIEHVEDAQEGTTEGVDSLNMGRIVPVYGLTSGITQRSCRRIVDAALGRYVDEAQPDPVPEAIRARQGLAPRAWALRQLHFPESLEQAARARYRLAFEELFVMQARLAIRRMRLAQRRKPQRYQPTGPLTESLRAGLPFELTGAQRATLQDITADVCGSAPMLRLLQGEVGCGKTIVAVHAAATAAQSGHQTALLAPTELLARQHYRVFRGYLEPLGVRVGLLSQGVPLPERAQLLQSVADGACHVVVGTHALLEEAVTFRDLSLAIIDEQHKFGVAQRNAFVRKGQAPNVLIMTATPIPRTLALSLYGDLACSTIDTLPPGRRPVRTVWHPTDRREDAERLVRQELAQGRQGYVVYPLVHAQERADIKAATQMAGHLQREAFKDFRVGLLHGQMASAGQERVMREFIEGRIQLLVSTVIVEVGLDVPNATVMVIEHPDRFGLSQLHQLRGRIGRSSHPAICLPIGDAPDDLARERLEAFASTNDGFKLAERDLELRGPGELLGRRQHGWMRFRVADLMRDRALLAQARREATLLIERDLRLSDPASAALRRRLQAMRVRIGP